MDRNIKPAVDRNGKPLPPPRGTVFPTVTLITDRELEPPAEFVIELMADNPIKKPAAKKKST